MPPNQSTDVELKLVSPHHASARNTGGAPRSVSNQTVKAKEPTRSAPSSPPQQHSKQPQPASASPTRSQMKKLTRKSSKPIINWFQRKLAGSVRSRRASDADALRAPRPVKERPSLKEQRRRSSVPSVPPLPLIQQNKKGGGKGSQGNKPDPVLVPKRNTISLDGSDDYNSYTDGHTVDSFDENRGSYARESLWSPTSLSVREADEDASVRPIPPSVPPSPSPSHSSSSYLSDPRTFASMAASTKPTTLLSVDLTAGGGMAHIAQAPPTPTLAAHRLAPHVRAHSITPSTVGSITFGTLPSTASSRPSPPAPGSNSRGQHGTLNAPQHTTHHPRYNPRPSSPPPDDASVLTLASSAFGIPGSRVGTNALTGRRSLADDSFSHISGAPGLGDSVSHFTPGDLDGDEDRMLMEADRYGDVDASVRALRPRSSRRGSWESEASGWSAHLGSGAPGTPSALRDKSLWTTPSFRTGTRSVNLGTEEEYVDKSDITHEDERSLAFTTSDVIHEDASDKESEKSHVEVVEADAAPAKDPQSPSQSSITSSVNDTGGPGATTPKREKGQETPRVSTLVLEDAPPPVPTLQDVGAKETIAVGSS